MSHQQWFSKFVEQLKSSEIPAVDTFQNLGLFNVSLKMYDFQKKNINFNAEKTMIEMDYIKP